MTHTDRDKKIAGHVSMNCPECSLPVDMVRTSDVEFIRCPECRFWGQVDYERQEGVYTHDRK